MKVKDFLLSDKSLFRFAALVPIVAIIEIISVGTVIPVINILGEENTSKVFLLNISFEKHIVFTGFILLTLFSLYCRVGFEKYRIKVAHSFAPRLQRLIVERYLNGSLNNKNRLSQADFTGIATSYVYEYTNKIITPILALYYNFIVFFALFLGLIYYSGVVVFLVFLIFGLIYFIIGLLIRKRTRDISKRLKKTLDNIYENLNVIYQNLISIIVESQSESVSNNLEKESKAHFNHQASSKFFAVMPKYLLEAMLVLSVISYVFLVPNIDMPRLIFLFLISQKLVPRLQAMYNSYVLYSTGGFAIEKISNYMESTILFRSPNKFSGGSSDEIQIEMKDVFQSRKRVFANLNLTIERKGKYLVQGESGGGKSTLIQNLLGLGNNSYECFIVNTSLGHDEWLKDSVFYLTQDYRIQSGSVREIIEKNSGFVGDDVIDEILTELNLDLSSGSNISSDGTNLSGGQRQRLLIACAVLSPKKLLILDEPTSALDKNIEKIVLEVIMKRAKDRTVLIISHSNLLLSHFTHSIKVNNGYVRCSALN